ncbi:MAG: DUF4432 family protein [Sphaerochaetaceae bacterium]|nr:DUF4432 family protein [Sphaerochaetaceae bacterium]
MSSRFSIPDWPEYPQEDIVFKTEEALIELFHHGDDDPSVRRLRVRWKQFVLVLLPTKGLTVLECTIHGDHLFWHPPLDRISAPDSVDLAGALLIDGERSEGTRWIANFTGGIEMLGLDNWGMHFVDKKKKLHTLHGNVSNIPAEGISIEEIDGHLKIFGNVSVYDDVDVLCADDRKAKWLIRKSVVLYPDRDTFEIEDTIINVSSEEAFADWGYHVQLRPKPGCRFLLPSGEVRERLGNPVCNDHSVWIPAKHLEKREERGYIHRRLKSVGGYVEGLLEYPEGTGLKVCIPHAPYTMVWNSCGGALSREFLLPSDPNHALIKKPWDGVGPEIGASSLDHDGDVDPEVLESALKPGKSRTLRISITMLNSIETQKMKKRITKTDGNTDFSKISAIASHVWRTAEYELHRLGEYFDRNAFVSCVNMLADHKGRVAVSGAGTSGVAARKFVHSLNCVEIQSYFLNPADAVHGALGSVGDSDLVFLISKGGGTREIVQLIPSLKAKNATIVAVTENEGSVLALSSNLVLKVAINKEADEFDMLATTSTLAVVALFDALAIAAMQVTHFTKEQFAIIHPSGAVGDRLLKQN